MRRKRTDDWDRPPDTDGGLSGGLSGPVKEMPPEHGAFGPEMDPLAGQLKSGGGLFAAFLAGALAGAAGVAAWVLLTWHTGTIFAIVALGVGYLVGLTVRLVGRGKTPAFGLVAAGLTLLSSMVGLVLSVAAIIARNEDIPFEEVLEKLDPATIGQVLGQVVSPLTIIILIFAIYESFRVAVVMPPRAAPPPDEDQLEGTDAGERRLEEEEHRRG